MRTVGSAVLPVAAWDADRRRSGVLVLALLVTSIDHTIINVAMPRLVGDLGASAADLQWWSPPTRSSSPASC